MPGARIVLVGEQPGDHEDETGRPFVGPAGRVLERALEAAGLGEVPRYTTNVVKHFKWEARGKRRIHQKPNQAEVNACLPWLLGELEAVTPEVVVLLGATAAQAMLGRAFRVTRQHGQLLTLPSGTAALATIHPSAVLRAHDGDARDMAFEGMVRDLTVVADELLSKS